MYDTWCIEFIWVTKKFQLHGCQIVSFALISNCKFCAAKASWSRPIPPVLLCYICYPLGSWSIWPFVVISHQFFVSMRSSYIWFLVRCNWLPRAGYDRIWWLEEPLRSTIFFLFKLFLFYWRNCKNWHFIRVGAGNCMNECFIQYCEIYLSHSWPNNSASGHLK
jgi:hypothetical protein